MDTNEHELTEKAHTFEQLPRESNKAFAAFRTYLDLGPERSLAATGAKLGKSKVMMEKWSRRHDWQNRVAAYVNYLAEVERLAIESLGREKAIDWSKVHEAQKIEEWKLRSEYLETLRDGLRRWKDNPKRMGSLEGLARLGEIFIKLGRMASGMPLETKEVKTEVSGKIEVEWEIALKKIYGRKEAVIEVNAEHPTSNIEHRTSNGK